MKLISWNVNGIRACITKGFYEFFQESDPDILCIQESKMQEGQQELLSDGYYQYFHSAEKKGYSGTITFTKKKPLSVQRDFGIEEHAHEGRVLTLEFDTFYMVNVYTPNSQAELKRLDYRLSWESAFHKFLKELEVKKPVIVCGDLNVAHKEIDLKNPKTNRNNPGFSDQERQAFTDLLDEGFVDTFRYFYPDLEQAYSWWSYRMNARVKNVGWRIDYFLVSTTLTKQLKAAKIHKEVFGSDHCPVALDISIDE